MGAQHSLSLVIAVFSAKGGVGKSLIAANLGVVFAAGHRLSTALIDLDAGSGAADLLLDVQPQRTWADLLPVMGELSPQHLALAITAHVSGLDLLACPERPDTFAEFTPRNEGVEGALTRPFLEALLSAFRQAYALVVLDLPPGMNAIAAAAFSLADIRLMVLTPDAIALRATRRLLASLPEDEKPLGLVLNQYSRGAAVTPNEIESHLGRKLYAILPVDPAAVWTNVSYGQPCVLKQKRGLGRALRELSKTSLTVAEQPGIWLSKR